MKSTFIKAFEGEYSVNNKAVCFRIKLKNSYITYCIGIAKCNPEDEFNLNIGIKIARYRALILYKQHLIKEYQEVMRYHKYGTHGIISKHHAREYVVVKEHITQLRNSIKKLRNAIKRISNEN